MIRTDFDFFVTWSELLTPGMTVILPMFFYDAHDNNNNGAGTHNGDAFDDNNDPHPLPAELDELPGFDPRSRLRFCFFNWDTLFWSQMSISMLLIITIVTIVINTIIIIITIIIVVSVIENSPSSVALVLPPINFSQS